jgi:N-acetylornithine carbamoyltransferase
MGHELTIAHPKDYELDDELMATINERAKTAGGAVRVVNSMEEAVDGADVVYAKSWGSKELYGNPEADIVRRSRYRRKWIVDEAKMARTNDALFMHCLPVRRNVIVTDEVIDSRNSVIIDEAENRLHVQKAVMKKLLGE